MNSKYLIYYHVFGLQSTTLLIACYKKILKIYLSDNIVSYINAFYMAPTFYWSKREAFIKTLQLPQKSFLILSFT